MVVGLSECDGHHIKIVSQYIKNIIYTDDSKPVSSTADAPIQGSYQSEIVVSEIKQIQKHLNKEEILMLVKNYKAGLTACQLAEKYGCYRTTVSKYLKASGVMMRNCPLSDKQIDQAVRLYKSGLSCLEVGKKLGTCSKTIYNKLIQRNVTMRDTHGRSY